MTDAPLEKNIQVAIIRRLKKMDGLYYFKVHGSVMGRAGIPDIIGCLRVPIRGKGVVGLFFALEVKRPGTHTTPIQDVEIARARRAAARVAVVRSADEAEEYLRHQARLLILDLESAG